MKMLVAIVAAGVVIAIATIASTKSKDADEYVYSRRDGFKPAEYGYRLPDGSWGFG